MPVFLEVSQREITIKPDCVENCSLQKKNRYHIRFVLRGSMFVIALSDCEDRLVLTVTTNSRFNTVLLLNWTHGCNDQDIHIDRIIQPYFITVNAIHFCVTLDCALVTN